MKLSIKKGDNVLILAGKDAGKSGEVLEVNREEGRVIVANINAQTHHKKPKNKDDKGGKIKSEGPIDVSNVQIICSSCKKATRVGHKILEGKSVRVCKKCGAELSTKKVVKSTATKKTVKAEPTVKTEKENTPTAKKTVKTASATEKKTATSSKKA